MIHPYKTQLLFNLEKHYAKENWIFKANFQREEILIILPIQEDIEEIYGALYSQLATLPDINHPNERVMISFCYSDGSSYCSRVINPSTQDEIHLALLGQLPTRRITDTDLQQL